VFATYQKQTQETTSTKSTLGLVDADQHFPAVRLGEGLYATDYAFFVADPSGEVFDGTMPVSRLHRHLSAAAQKLYSVFPDAFDFIVVMPSGTIFDPEGNYGEDAPADAGSGPKLLGAMALLLAYRRRVRKVYEGRAGNNH
jgi:hypothetical protein